MKKLDKKVIYFLCILEMYLYENCFFFLQIRRIFPAINIALVLH